MIHTTKIRPYCVSIWLLLACRKFRNWGPRLGTLWRFWKGKWIYRHSLSSFLPPHLQNFTVDHEENRRLIQNRASALVSRPVNVSCKIEKDLLGKVACFLIHFCIWSCVGMFLVNLLIEICKCKGKIGLPFLHSCWLPQICYYFNKQPLVYMSPGGRGVTDVHNSILLRTMLQWSFFQNMRKIYLIALFQLTLFTILIFLLVVVIFVSW